jgi:hypothetical protein
MTPERAERRRRPSGDKHHLLDEELLDEEIAVEEESVEDLSEEFSDEDEDFK